MKDKKVLGIIAGLLVLLVGAYFLFFANKNQSPAPTAVEEEALEEISAEELGLIFELRSDKKAARFTISNIDDIRLVEYEISYLKDVNGEEVPEGLIGEVEKEAGDKTLGIDYREFGTCSSGVCRYDKVVSPVKLLLKITKENGKVYQAESSLSL